MTTLNQDRVKRIVRLMLAHVVDDSIRARDVDNVFGMASADDAHRDAVLRGLAQAGVHVIPDVTASGPGTDRNSLPAVTPADEEQAVPPQAASAEDLAEARRVLNLDRMFGGPSKRILTAQQEVGLAALIRGCEIPLGQDLPDGYRRRLDAEDERAQAFDAFMLHNMRLVWSIARAHAGEGLELDDIVQNGMLGLYRAVEKFDATKGYKFSTYATWWIRQSIDRGIANEGRLVRLPVHMVERMAKVLRARSRLLTENGSAELAQIMSETGLPAKEVIECLRLSAGIVSLDKPIEDSGETLGDFVLQQPDNDADPAEIIDRMGIRLLIRATLDELTEREATVISLRNGLVDDEPRTLEEIGKVFGLTRERIRQIEDKARKKLRVAFTARGLRPIRRKTTERGKRRNPEVAVVRSTEQA